MKTFDLDSFLPYLLNQAAEVTSQSFQSVYRRDHGMTRTQWRVMANLGKHGALSAVDICRLTFIEKTKVSRAVQALEDKGFLNRAVSKEDRRLETLRLTTSGQRVFQKLGEKARAFDAALRKSLGKENTVLLERMLRELKGVGNAEQDRA